MIKSNIPKGGNIPPSIRRKNRISRIGLNINLGGFGITNLGNDVKSQKRIDDFKPRKKYPEKEISKEKIDIEKMKTWVIAEIAHLLELKDGNKKIDIENKKQFLLNIIPDSLIEKVLKEAKKLSKEEK